MNRQKLVLALLLLALVGSVGYALLRSPKQQSVPTLKNRPGTRATVIRKGATPAKAVAVDTGIVHLEQLNSEMPGFSGFRRNIFSPIFHEEAAPTKPLRLPPPPPPVKLPALPPPMAQPPTPPPPPPPTQEQMDETELGKFIFLGFLKKGGERTVFLSKNNEIFLAKKGSQLGSKFQVSDVTEEAITIKAVGTDRQLVIPLIENRTLSTRRTSPRP